MYWFMESLKKYFVIGGRARRKEFWMFYLVTFLISIGLALIDVVTGTYDSEGDIGLLGGLFALFTFVPGLTLSIRRLHDTNRSGWWLLILLIPFLGVLIWLYFMVSDSDRTENDYGLSPKYSRDY